MSRLRAEIWVVKDGKPSGTIGIFDAHVPIHVGHILNAVRVDYEVVQIDWSIDHAGDVMRSTLRQNIYVKRRRPQLAPKESRP